MKINKENLYYKLPYFLKCILVTIFLIKERSKYSKKSIYKNSNNLNEFQKKELLKLLHESRKILNFKGL